jgi:competence protein ComEC
VEAWIEEELKGWGSPLLPPRRRAMVGLLFPVVAGAAVGLAWPFSPLWFWGAAALLILPLFLWIQHRLSVIPLMAVVFLLMAAHARQSTGVPTATSLPVLLSRPMEYVQLVVVATGDAIPRAARPGRASGAVFHARVEGLNRDGAWRKVDDRIRVILRGSLAGKRMPRYGERWRLHGIVRPALPRRSGLFMLPQNQMVVDPDRAVFLSGNHGNPVKAWCMRQRRTCRRILGRGLEAYPDERGILQALLLGYRGDLPRALRTDFAATGTVHIFAISGAHVGMMLLLFAGLLRALRIPVTRWFLFLTPLLILYTLTTGAATSAIRASVMASLMLGATFMKRRPDAISALAVAAISILVVSPAQLGDLGFLLSFTAVGGLLAVQPVMEAGVRRLAHRDEWLLPGEDAPDKPVWRRGGMNGIRYASVSVSAWISTLPLTAYFFNLFSPVALLMNLIVIPVVFAILLTGVMSLLCFPLSPFCSEVFNHAARVLASGLTACIQWAATLPWGHLFIRTPPAAGVVLWYLLLAVAAVMARRVRGALAVGLGVLALLGAGWSLWDAGRCRVSVLGVGEGNAVLVQARTERMLVDTGPEFRAEQTLRLMRREGVNRLAVLVLTHSDAQHMGAAHWMMQALPVQELWIPAVVWPSPLMKKTLLLAQERGVQVRRLAAGEQGPWPNQLSWEILWPPADLRITRSDEASLVMRVARYGVSILLTGDAGGNEERRMQERGDSLASRILLLGRHGARSATSGSWLDAVCPKEALVSAGPHVEGQHPDREVLERLSQREIHLWETDRDGSLQIDFFRQPARWPDPGYRIQGDPR